MRAVGFIGIALIAAAVVLGFVAILLRRRPNGAAPSGVTGGAELDLDHPRPKVAEFHVRGEEAHVRFDVPLPPGEIDTVLHDLLVHEAVEVVREKRHHLPIEGVTKVVAFAGRDGEPRLVGDVELKEPGVLPPPLQIAPTLQLSSVGFDPLDQQFEAEAGEQPPGVMEHRREDVLQSIGAELRIPKAVDVGLRAQGVDPDAMSAGELVRGMLSLFGYQVTPSGASSTYVASKGGGRTFLREDVYEAGSYPELEDGAMRTFLVDFLSSGADRGILVSDRFGPFDVYERERREPRVRYVTRERLQKFVDALALE